MYISQVQPLCLPLQALDESNSYIDYAHELNTTLMKGYSSFLDLKLPMHNDTTFKQTQLWLTFVEGTGNSKLQSLAYNYEHDRKENTMAIIRTILKPYTTDMFQIFSGLDDLRNEADYLVERLFEDLLAYEEHSRMNEKFFM